MANRALLVALLMVATLYGAQGQSAACPLGASDLAQVNWTPVRAACNVSSNATSAAATAAFCEACLCSVNRAIATGLNQTRLQVNTTQSALDKLVDSCAATVGAEIVSKASLPATALTALGQCDAAATSKKCIAALVKGATTPAANSTNATAAVRSAAGGRDASVAVAAVASLLLGAALLA